MIILQIPTTSLNALLSKRLGEYLFRSRSPQSSHTWLGARVSLEFHDGLLDAGPQADLHAVLARAAVVHQEEVGVVRVQVRPVWTGVAVHAVGRGVEAVLALMKENYGRTRWFDDDGKMTTTTMMMMVMIRMVMKMAMMVKIIVIIAGDNDTMMIVMWQGC